MRVNKVSILGGGNGGFAAAADLSSRGFSVSLFELPRFEANIRDAAQKGGIEVKGRLKSGFIKIDKITTDIKEAIKGVDIILLVIPAYGVEEFAEQCIPHLRDGQEIILNGASSLGALRFSLIAKKMAPSLKIKVAETASLTYASRKTGPCEVDILLFVQNIFFSAFPASYTKEMLGTFQTLYPSVLEAKNVLETTLNCGNPLVHVPGSILNAGLIDSGKILSIYTEGISPSVARVIEAVDGERLALCKAMGFREITTKDRIVRYGYNRAADTLYEGLVKSKVFAQAKGPFNTNSRYLAEDTPYGLVLWSSLGNNLRVPTPLSDAFIDIAAALCRKNFKEDGLTMEKLGLDGLNASQLNHYLMTGER